MPGPHPHCTAFNGSERIASGELSQVALKAKRLLARSPASQVLIFDDASGDVIDVDYRGTAQEVAARLATAAPPPGGARTHASSEPETLRGRGRPKLGVVAREVTLLPRHWEWLNSQPGGASVALRRLVEDARKRNAGADRRRRAQEAAYRFMSAMAGDRSGFEEAARALFAGARERFAAETKAWPRDIRTYAAALAEGAF